MPTLTVDGKQITVPEGTTVIQAAEQIGVVVPRYCYHPGLSIAGNCRICQVEIEKMPKLQISCQILCADGMVVHTKSDRVQDAQKSTLEFLLANHPLDCPVCDQSGECYLQDYYMDFGQYDPACREKKVKKKKAIPVSKNVMLDQERCILCSRCVRYTDEITETHEFGIFNRGDHAEVGIAPGVDFDQNAYQGNVVDICPVGALTDRDFRFKCRVWYLASGNSVCTGCSRGCNITIDWNKERPYQTPGERVMRYKPRYNKDVNEWWLCDEGRYSYKMIDQNRITKPHTKVEGVQQEVSWDTALSALDGEQLKEIAVIASPHMTNEEIQVVKEFFRARGNHSIVLAPPKMGNSDDFLMQADKSPNQRGASAILGVGNAQKIEEILAEAEAGKMTGLWIFWDDLCDFVSEERVKAICAKLSTVVFCGTHWNKTAKLAKVVLPAPVFAEKEGTFTNFEGRVQRIEKVLEPLGEARPVSEILEGFSSQSSKPGIGKATVPA